ncbi:MAG: peptidylprolyl isomerase [Nitrospinota bacterium]
MKLKFVISILAAISIFLAGIFFSACNKKNESPSKASAETGKTFEAIEKFEKIGEASSPENTLKLIDEASNSLPEVVASVNDVKITSRPIKASLQRLKVQASHQNQVINKQQIKQMVNQILETEIQREVMFQHGKKLKIEVLDKDVSQIIDLMKSRFNNEEEFLKEFSKRGMNFEMLKKQISRNIVVTRVIQKKIHDKIEISDQQTMDFYKKNEKSFKNPESVHAAHILIKVDNKFSDKDKKIARKKIEDILKKAREGEDFAVLAKQYSEGPSASRGGDLSNITRNQMVKEFEYAVFKLKEGEISDVVETQFGFHIIKAYEKKEAGGLLPFDQVKENISNFLKRAEAEQRAKTYIEDLERKADIKRFI